MMSDVVPSRERVLALRFGGDVCLLSRSGLGLSVAPMADVEVRFQAAVEGLGLGDPQCRYLFLN